MIGIRTPKALTVVCLTLLYGSIVSAEADGDGAVESFLVCAAVTNDAKRLACYDREAARPDASEASDSAETTATISNDSENEAPSKVSSTDSADNFGIRSNEKGERTELVVTVADVRKRPYGQLIVTLENGQVWTEKNAVKGLRIKKGDTLTIRRGSFGGYRFITRNKRSSAAKRVE